MTYDQLFESIIRNRSFLCVGLDTDLQKIPQHLLAHQDPILTFNKAIIDATHPYCIGYKPNTAFYEAMGSKGWDILQATIDYIPSTHFVIADAKRGDIGNTSSRYATAFFEYLKADAITVAPYMGADSVKPFLEYPNKWVISLALTSNQGSADFQLQQLANGKALFEWVLEQSSQWGTKEQLMFVVGATHPDFFVKIRSIIPEHFLLVPGIGAQGGNLEATFKNGHHQKVGLIVNASRSIIYASHDHDFAQAAGKAAHKLQQEMERLLLKHKLLTP